MWKTNNTQKHMKSLFPFTQKKVTELLLKLTVTKLRVKKTKKK